MKRWEEGGRGDAADRGGGIEEVARELKMSVPEIEKWKRRFLAAGREDLKARGLDPVAKELAEAKQTIGDLTMEINLHKKKQRFVAGMAATS